ncbi:hypothetical protein [Leptolyngbya sp. NIES-2104]|uniref:hypothetical protein n=1 Tax=Leptolyngbya sp. NIES-2104 TaxID=1552121 RepID=UPI0006ECA592|nr:hypothetical protein [Leptolyngbya sp. NIES-2104]GAP95974.1 hypothetical protein NIES2104_25030 [Leptolyngbya sp. NIES-2104]
MTRRALNRIAAYLLGGVAFVASLIYLSYVDQLGFPDGFISELGYAQRNLAYLFIGISVVLGTYFIYLGAIAARKSIEKKLAIAVLSYLICIVVIAALNYYYRLHLPGSGG